MIDNVVHRYVSHNYAYTRARLHTTCCSLFLLMEKIAIEWKVFDLGVINQCSSFYYSFIIDHGATKAIRHHLIREIKSDQIVLPEEWLAAWTSTRCTCINCIINIKATHVRAY